MTANDHLTQEHSRLRQQIAEMNAALAKKSKGVSGLFDSLQKDIVRHFRKEDTVYYRIVDENKQMGDRELMHDLRNDHAAVVFSLESLGIKLRKGIPLEEWKKKFDQMSQVFLSHLTQEEKSLFPYAAQKLGEAKMKDILTQIERL